MTINPESGERGDLFMAKRGPLPILGVSSLVAGAILPAWTVLVMFSGGLEAAAWVPVMAFFYPFNLMFLPLFILAVLCGIFARRNPGTDRALGGAGLILAGLQLVAVIAYLAWSFFDIGLGLGH
ncbi:MAG: hypothetical protein Q4P23_06815 [Micrococcaceae bacterium]|nr:hypothetical protein [Micrococcaceae bacterium]